MLQILTITSPIYLIIALGYLVVRLGYFNKTEVRAMGRFIFMVAMPALLFNVLVDQHANVEIEWAYVLVYAIGSMLALTSMTAYTRFIRRKPVATSSIQGMASAAANTAFIGFPILYPLFGPTAAVGLAMCMIVENILVMPLGLAYADSQEAEGHMAKAFLQSLLSLLRNPLLWGMGLGLLFNTFGWLLPAVPERMVQMLAQIASPLALFVVGGSLVGLQIGHQLRDIFTVVGAKLFLHPLLVALALLFFPSLDSALAITAVVFAAMPTAALVTVLAQRYGEESFAAGVLLVATSLSFFTITLLLLVATRLWPVAL